MSHPALSERLQLGGQAITVQVSPVRTYDDYGPYVDVVHICARREDGAPLALRDVHPAASREAAYNLWSFLCDQLSAAATLAYGLAETPDTQPNPRLGCWGPRPDLAAGSVDDDGATALVLGVAIDTRGASTPRRRRLLVLALRSALVAALRRWTEDPESRSDIASRLN